MLDSGFTHRFHRNAIRWKGFCISRGSIGPRLWFYQHNCVCRPLQITVNDQFTVQAQLQLDLRSTTWRPSKTASTTLLFVSRLIASLFMFCFWFRRHWAVDAKKKRSFKVVAIFGDHMLGKTGGFYVFDVCALHALCSRERNADEVFWHKSSRAASFRPASSCKMSCWDVCCRWIYCVYLGVMINNRAVRPTLAWTIPSVVSLSLHSMFSKCVSKHGARRSPVVMTCLFRLNIGDEWKKRRGRCGNTFASGNGNGCRQASKRTLMFRLSPRLFCKHHCSGLPEWLLRRGACEGTGMFQGLQNWLNPMQIMRPRSLRIRLHPFWVCLEFLICFRSLNATTKSSVSQQSLHFLVTARVCSELTLAAVGERKPVEETKLKLYAGFGF